MKNESEWMAKDYLQWRKAKNVAISTALTWLAQKHIKMLSS